MKKGISGFTIVELLIVIVVIAVLATITIVAYNGIQNRAYDSSIQSDLKSLATKLELFKIDSPTSVYPNPTSELPYLGFKATKNAYQTAGTNQNLSYCFSANYGDYIVVAKSKSGSIFVISTITKAPKISNGSWDNGNPSTACSNAEPTVTTTGNLRGYAPDDVATGPWRAWVGGN